MQNLIPDLMNDLRYALRQLRKSPGFTLTAVLTLSLTVGLAATVFSVFDALLLRPLPYAQPDRIVNLEPRSPSGYTQPASWPEYEFWRAQNHSFSTLAGLSSQTMNFRGPAGPVAIHAVHATDNFFDVLGVQPLLGRTFLPSENVRGRTDVVVLSYELWQKDFAGSRGVLNATVELDGRPMTVIGIMPASFRFPLQWTDTAFAPFRSSPDELKSGSHFMRTIARLKPGTDLAAATAEMNNVLAAYAHIDPDSSGRRMQLETLPASLVGQTRNLLNALVLAVLAVLALGCVNIAGLMLVRGLRRQRELALRLALGASRQRLASQLSTEIIFLAVLGTLGGGAAAFTLLQTVSVLLKASLARGSEVALRPEVLLASLAAALCTLLLAGLLPMRQLLSVAPADSLRSGSAGSGVSRAQSRLGAVFIAAQMAFAMVLLVTSGLLLRSLLTLRTTDLGFRSDHLLIEDINLSPGEITGRNIMRTFYQPLLAQIKAMPGVESAAIINLLPVADYGMNSDVQIVGQPPAPKDRQVLAELRFLTPDYYNAMGTRLLRGRLFDDKLDTATSQSVIVVNQAFVRKFFSPGEDPIGKQTVDNNHATIIGVVSDQRQSLYEPPCAEMDLAVAQLPPDVQTNYMQEMQLVIRTRVDPLTLSDPLRALLQKADPGLPFRPLLTMGDVVNQALTLERLENWLFGAFAVLAVLLASIGLYGLISQQVEQSRRETGVRMALGAQRLQVLAGWMRRVAGISLAGLAAGLLLCLALRKVIASVLSVQPQQEALFLALLLLAMECTALLAALLPAKRAASVEPIEALRAE